MKRLLPTALLACLSLGWCISLQAQDSNTNPANQIPSTTENPLPPANAVTLTRVAELADNTEKLIAQMRQLAIQPVEFEEMKDKLGATRKKLMYLRDNSNSMMEDPKTTLEQIQANQNVWRYAVETLAQDQQAPKSRAQALEAGIAQLAADEQQWLQTREQMGDAPELADAIKQAKKAINDLGTTRKLLGVPLQETLAIVKEWQDLIDTANEQEIASRQHEIEFRRHLLTSLQEPLWKMSSDSFQINDSSTRFFELQLKLTWHYLQRFPARPLIVLGSMVGVLVFLWRLRVQRNRAQEGQPGIGLRLPLIDRPASTTVATTIAVALMVYPDAPQLFRTVLSFLLFIPVARLGMSRLPVIVRPLAWLVSVLFVANSLTVVTEAIPALQRAWILCCAIVSTAIYMHTLRKLSHDDDHDSLGWKTLRVAIRTAIALSLVAFTGEMAGAVSLAQFLMTGLANAAYAGLCLVVVVAGIFSDLGVAAIYMPTSTSSQLINRNRPLLVGRIGKLSTAVCVLAWIHFTLIQFSLADPLWHGISAVLNSELSIGNLAVSLGDVLAVVVTIWLSFKISQLLRFIFMEDIAPRTGLARGVPDAIATLMHYVIILVGFMMAISAAGIDMSKLAIMAGALGVGIGIGLQDVVNNFTSGLILLFEQHIKQQDIIQCSTVNGRVLQIGLRASVVRTFDGAEVIVPNGQLVSAQVINWTHSDQQRRIAIPVGVAYGSDPEQVIRVLLGVAQQDPDILPDPQPTAFFLRFGPSSMDFELRAWICSGDQLLDVTSRLCTGIVRAFSEENIGIPFPQQDVHLRLPDNFIVNTHTQSTGKSS